MDDNNKAALAPSGYSRSGETKISAPRHALTAYISVIPELDELEALILLMMTADMSSISLDSRSHLLALAYRVISTALDKAHSEPDA